MCKCREIDGFKEALRQAKLLTKSTGIEHVVFNVMFQGKKQVTYGSVASAEKSGACCYYTKEGVEVKITPKPKKDK